MHPSDLSPELRAYLEPVAGREGVFAFNPPPLQLDPLPFNPGDGSVARFIAQAQDALVRLQTTIEFLPNPDLVTRTLSRREAVMSSHIEGTQAGVQDVLEYESTHDAEGLPPDTRSTLDYVKALEFGLQRVRAQGVWAFTPDFISALHAELMCNDPGYRDAPGSFRTIQNWVGGLRIQEARLVPPPPHRVPDAVAELATSVLRYEPEGNAYVHVIVRAAMAHAQFEAIHPFRDGNGRLGRLLMGLMFAAEGLSPLYVSGPLYRNRQEYFDCLLGAQLRSRWSNWVGFFAQAVTIAADESMETARRLLALREVWRARVQDRRADAASRRLVEHLVGTPVLTANQAKALLDVSFPAANNALADLVKAGILTSAERSRNRVFVAAEAIEILDERPARPVRPRRRL